MFTLCCQHGMMIHISNYLLDVSKWIFMRNPNSIPNWSHSLLSQVASFWMFHLSVKVLFIQPSAHVWICPPTSLSTFFCVFFLSFSHCLSFCLSLTQTHTLNLLQSPTESDADYCNLPVTQFMFPFQASSDWNCAKLCNLHKSLV